MSTFLRGGMGSYSDLEWDMEGAHTWVQLEKKGQRSARGGGHLCEV